MSRGGLFLVVMAGGSGTRFWPKSTSKKPKQLLSFGTTGTPTLLQQTLSRFDGLVPAENRMIVTTGSLSPAVAGQAPGVRILAEPQGRNTAPCVYWAAREVQMLDPDGIMLVMPSDHYIPDIEKFQATVRAAAGWAAQNGDLVALGVKPSRPETGYGYLRTIAASGPVGARKVETFVEKPDLARAEEYVKSGRYLWNGGMFIWRASVILEAFDRFMPELGKAWSAAGGDAQKAYPSMTATSIDYGVMEKAANAVTFELDCGWDDLGSWIALENMADVLGARREGGVVTGGELLAIQSGGNIVDAPGRLVAILGLSNLVVVEHGGAILVTRKDKAQDIKLVVDKIRQARPELV